MANVIEQIVSPASYGGQIIEMNVRSNERGPQGEKGDPGESATVNAGQAYTVDYRQQPQVMNSGTPENAVLDFYIPAGQPGAIHYTAGPGINITEDNVIEATGEAATHWGDLTGNINAQTDLMNKLNAKQNNLIAGTNITISGDTISSKNYTAGTGLNLNGGEFSVDTDTIQTKLTAGTNVQISSGTISATDTTYNNFIGADGGSGGSAGLVPAPVASDNVKVLKGDGTWGLVGTDNIDDGVVTATKLDKTTVLDLFYPVGTYYETSDTNFNPNTAWGGTWVEDSWGRVTVAYQSDQSAFDTVGEVGGELSHTLTINEMPSHNHTLNRGNYGNMYLEQVGYSDGGNPRTESVTIGYTGGGQAHNNLQPYIVVRRWHRTA